VRGVVREGAFTVNLFDPLQSRLAPAAQLPVAHSTDFTSTSSNVPRVLREIWPEIAALLLLILCLEWWLFGRSYGLQLKPTSKDQETAAYLHTGNRLQAHKSTGRFAILQDQIETQYRIARKRLAKATKRIRGKYTRQRSKGNIDAHL
jgi:hypothetical protein